MKIAFERAAYRTNSETHGMNSDGSGDTKLASNIYYNASPRCSPHGVKIVCAGPSSGPYCGNNYEIYTMNAGGTGQADVTDDPAEDLSPIGAWPRATLFSVASPPDNGK